MKASRWLAVLAGVVAVIVGSVIAITMARTPSPSPAALDLPPSAMAVSPSPVASPRIASPTPVSPTAVPPKPKPKPTPAKPAAPSGNLAQRLTTLPAGTSQVIIVHANSYHTTYATLETFTRVGGVWKQAFAPMAARVGKDGFSDHHLEYVPNTPVGVYGFGATMYGIASNPGVKYGYHKLVADDYWNENPKSSAYNRFEHGSDPGGASEALWTTYPAYTYFAFITYNVPAVAGAGSGIFLHVSGSGPTAGCVSVSKANLIRVLTWLDPSKSPRIVLSPDSQLHRF